MISILSPAKSLNFSKVKLQLKASKPAFLSETAKILTIMRKYKASELSTLFKVSANLAELNVERYKNFDLRHNESNSKVALLAYSGDVYEGLSADDLKVKDLQFADQHIRILSGLYGYLRPLDLIQPYRLEMGSRIKPEGKKTLYDFWQTLLVESMLKELKKQKNPKILNLASIEYAKVLKSNLLTPYWIDLDFKEQQGASLKTVGLFAKRARGLMARYIVKNRIEKIEDLKTFNLEGYKFAKSLSLENSLIFTRKSKK